MSRAAHPSLRRLEAAGAALAQAMARLEKTGPALAALDPDLDTVEAFSDRPLAALSRGIDLAAAIGRLVADARSAVETSTPLPRRNRPTGTERGAGPERPHPTPVAARQAPPADRSFQPCQAIRAPEPTALRAIMERYRPGGGDPPTGPRPVGPWPDSLTTRSVAAEIREPHAPAVGGTPKVAPSRLSSCDAAKHLRARSARAGDAGAVDTPLGQNLLPLEVLTLLAETSPTSGTSSLPGGSRGREASRSDPVARHETLARLTQILNRVEDRRTRGPRPWGVAPSPEGRVIPGQPGTSRDSESATAWTARADGLRGLAGRAIQEATPPPGVRLADPITERIHEGLLTDRLSRILRREAERSGIACDGVDA